MRLLAGRLLHQPGWLLWAATAARLVLALAFGLAGALKVTDPAKTVRAVRAYRLLPEGAAVPFAHALPWLELGVAVLLLLGLATRVAAAASVGLMLLFVAGISSAALRGLRLDCGCFGGGGPTAHPHYGQELLRDGALLGLAVGLLVVGRSRLALDAPRPDRVPEGPVTTRRQRAEAARARAALESRGRRDRVVSSSAVGGLVVLSLAGVLVGHASLSSARGPVPPGTTARGGVLVGSSGAQHHLVVYEDPQCPVCESFERASGGVIASAVRAGRVQVEYRMRSFLGPESVRAVAALGAAADVGAFEALRAQMFSDQPREGTGGFAVDDLLHRGSLVGITATSYAQAVREQTYAPWARRVDDLASRDGNVGTPDLLLDGRRLALAEAFDPVSLARALGLPVTPGAGPAS